jgi:hypothetical protein
MKRLIIALLFLALVPGVLQAQLYGVSLNGYTNGNPGPSSLYMVDTTTGAGTLIGDIGYPVNSISIDPTTGTMYGIVPPWDGAGQLLTIDSGTGAGTVVGSFDQDRCVVNVMFDSTGQMFGRDECSPITIDGLVTIDKATAVITDVGVSGFPGNTQSSVMAFDAADTLHFVDGPSQIYYLFDTGTGLATNQKTLTFSPGSGGATFDPSGLLWAPAGVNSGRIQDSIIRISDLAAETFSDIDTDIEYLNALTLNSSNVVAGTARFGVTKTFTNGDTGDVEVTLTCNGGIPLQQSFTISGGGPGVTFTVTNLPDTGANCAVTESGGNEGYMADLSACSWTGVTGGLRTCPIMNVPEATTVSVDTTVDTDGDATIDPTFTTTIVCENVSPDTGPVFGTVTVVDTSGLFEADWYPDPVNGTDCTVTMVPNASAVEGDSCSFSFDIGDEEAGCDVEGTVFFEGIPTLSQYGLALMALLMLGIGFVGMRRIV